MKKIAVVTGGRADFGLLAPLCRRIRDEPSLDLRLIVTGSHLSRQHGQTITEIERDDLDISDRIEIDLGDDTAPGICCAMAQLLEGFAAAVMCDRPDVVIVLGDRYEIFCAVQVAMFAGIPVAHIHGGEITEGAIDEALRHAITKMSSLHFTATETYRTRVIEMGEPAERVHNVGALAIDTIKHTPVLPLSEIEQYVALDLSSGFLLVTFHPVTLADDGGISAMNELVAALDEFETLKVVMTGINADPGYAAVSAVCSAYAARNPGRVALVQSLGHKRYVSALHHAWAVVGNSSSGIIEAPAIPVPTVNVGRRQRGRLRVPSIIDCNESRFEIAAAIRRAISPEMRAIMASMISPYGEGRSASAIVEVLARENFDGLKAKRFVDGGPAATDTSPISRPVDRTA